MYCFAKGFHLSLGGKSKFTTYVGASVTGSGGYFPDSHVSLNFGINNFYLSVTLTDVISVYLHP